LEIEVNWRAVILLIILAVIVVAGLFLAPRFRVSGRKRGAETTAVATDAPSTQEVVANPIDIEFQNDSSWRVTGIDECLPKFKNWLGDQYPLASLTVVMTDTVNADMVLATRQSGSNAPDAEVTGECAEENKDNLICNIAVKQGEESDNLDVAATVEIAWLVQEFYRPKTKDSWEKLQHQKQGFEAFQPLITMEDNQWTSDCLHLTR